MPSTYIGLPAIEAKVRAGLLAGVDASAEKLARKSAATAPVDEGILAGGIESDGASMTGPDTAEAIVHTGAGADEYAIIQHQRREGVKYVEGPLLEHMHEHADTVADHVRRRLR